jgi:alpha-tubulin suppressor-like RCC1 family protein
VVSGLYHSCAIGVDGTVTCWGAGNPNDTSGYDNCSPPARYNYGQATAPTGTFKQIAAGGYTTCGIKTDGTLACWGAGTTNGNCQSDYGACGQALPPSGTFVEVAVGYTHACAMTAAGKVQCWGSNTGGKATPPAELQ